jgi:hypothetical protein
MVIPGGHPIARGNPPASMERERHAFAGRMLTSGRALT